MIWGIRTSMWFGIALAAVLFFLWCLIAMLERDAIHSGLVWGLIVFGAIALASGAIALICQISAGGVPRGRDALMDVRPSRVPHSAAGRGLRGSGYRPMRSGELPKPSAGRGLT